MLRRGADAGTQTPGAQLRERSVDEEQARLAALYRMKVLDTEAEPAFDDLALLASHICQTPMAAITFIDTDRQWFKARVGAGLGETPRAVAFCARAINHDGIFVVRDAQKIPSSVTTRRSQGIHTSGSTPGPCCPREGHAWAHCASSTAATDADPRPALCTDALRRQWKRSSSCGGGSRAEGLARDVQMTAMMPFCSTCQFTMTIPAVRRDPSSHDGLTSVLRREVAGRTGHGGRNGAAGSGGECDSSGCRGEPASSSVFGEHRRCRRSDDHRT